MSSRLQWLQDGERPSKYLSSLENKIFIKKTMKKVKRNNGEFITNQEDIFHEIQQYYCNIFDNRDNQLQDISLKI